MPSVPDPANVKPWYLRNITEALALDDATGNVYVRTGFTGNIVIAGNVNIPGNVQVFSSPEDPVHTHITEVGNSGILTTTYMPIGGDITGNVIVNSGNVAITSLPEVEIKNDTGNPISISKDSNVNSTTNRIYVSMETDAIIADSNYEMNVARGLVPGQYVELKNGYCLSMAATGGAKTIWSQDSVYPWASWDGVAQTLYIVSDSASDVGQQLYIEGLDATYTKITDTVTTNGLTAVPTNKPFFRINRAYLISGNENVGMITQRLTNGTGTVMGGMLPGTCRNKQGVFTVPKGYNAYILYGDVTSYKNGQGQVDGQVDMKVRVGTSMPFQTVFAAISANGQYRNDFNVPLLAPEYADIDVRFDPSGACTVACNWEMILIAK